VRFSHRCYRKLKSCGMLRYQIMACVTPAVASINSAFCLLVYFFATFSEKKKTVFGSKLVICYFCSIELFGAETWTCRNRDHKYLGSFKIWCWRRMQKIGWTSLVNNKEAHTESGKKEKSNLQKNEGTLTGLVTRHSNCLTKHVI